MLLGVILGAFAAHALKLWIPQNLFNAFQTGVHYQIYHGLGLILLGIIIEIFPVTPLLRWSAGLMLGGIVLFSGSLYALAMTEIKIFGAITPLGGSLLIISWLLFSLGILKIRDFQK